jgi:hypothetical protein
MIHINNDTRQAINKPIPGENQRVSETVGNRPWLFQLTRILDIPPNRPLWSRPVKHR